MCQLLFIAYSSRDRSPLIYRCFWLPLVTDSAARSLG